MKKILSYIAAFTVLFFSLFYIASRDPENYEKGSWKSSLFVDPAGYNVYLPATFQYNFIHNFPEKTDSIVGYGFMLNKDKKVITKFTYGVALLQSPFYITGLAISKIFHIENTGYSYFNQVLIDVCGIFYACLGLILLYLFLTKCFSNLAAFISCLVIFIGTNTLYYASILPGMSHIYSFFLVNASLFFFSKYLSSAKQKYFVLTIFCFAILVLIRPINILFGLILLTLEIRNADEFKKRLTVLFHPRNLFITALLFSIVFIPQFIYWKFAYGSFIADSYPGEGFTNLVHPRLKSFLFAPHNGALLYCPLYAILFLCVPFLFRAYKILAVSYLLTIGLIIYLSASWYLYFFGCGFGARNLVEYSGALAFPLGYCIQYKRRLILLISPIILVSVFLNLKLMYSWELCFWGKDDYAWKEYRYLLKQPTKTLLQNLDSVGSRKVLTLNNERVYHLTKDEEYSPGFAFHQNDFTKSYFKKATIELDHMAVDTNAIAHLVCMSFDGDSTVFFNAAEINGKYRQWKTIKWLSGLPFDEDKNYLIKIFIMNKEKHEFYFRNFSAKLE